MTPFFALLKPAKLDLSSSEAAGLSAVTFLELAKIEEFLALTISLFCTCHSH